MRILSSIVFLCLIFVAPQYALAQISLDLEAAFPNLSFSRPVDIQHAGDGSDRIFVVEQNSGRILVFENNQAVTSSSTFLDLDGINTGGEEGLLGLAFHPDYENNGHFFVYYSASGPRRSVISRFSVDANNANLADPSSELVILEVNQPYSNHNGGQLAFSPLDGFLYIGLGDGGDGGDPGEHGENPKTLLGSFLRIDVNNSSEAERYAIPDDNPFVGNEDGFREEIFAYGLRNPWRFSIDPETGDIWAGDVGQGSREEIDLIEKGVNYGWDIMEASLCFEPRNDCDTTDLRLPVWEYGRSLGVSVTGGHVYRGTRVPEIAGKYIYGDFATGRIWALTRTDTDTTNVEIATASFNIPAFGVSEGGDLYIADYNGNLFRFVETQPTGNDTPYLPQSLHKLGVNFPNPTTGSTTIPFSLATPAEIELSIFDLLGRKVATVSQGSFPAGEHQAEWSNPQANSTLDAGHSQLPPGPYFYSLRVDEHIVQTRMLLLVK